jgi:hypothetical protein
MKNLQKLQDVSHLTETQQNERANALLILLFCV